MLFSMINGNTVEIKRSDYVTDGNYYSSVEAMYKVYIKPTNIKTQQVRMNNLDALSHIVNMSTIVNGK